MKVFISWSGKKSHAVASVLHEWLPTVINSVEPWVSSEGLRAGLKWNQQLEKELNDTSFGIIVATPKNQHAQWLNFEAGALSKKVGGAESRVAPLLIDFKKVTDLVGPLASYQATEPTKSGFHDLVASINEALGDDARSIELLDRAFEVCWPALEAMLKDVNEKYKEDAEQPAESAAPPAATRPTEDMLSEILETIRDMNRSDTRLKNILDEKTSSRKTRSGWSDGTRKTNTVTAAITKFLREDGHEPAQVFSTLDGTTHIFLSESLPAVEEKRIYDFLSATGLISGGLKFNYPDGESVELSFSKDPNRAP
ncbi:TIR domain-containing protein [Arthrobacter globiformis]|uniref:TIR domain-containing protein n=1 Tax=Arthrobacter globiformis TaxID=1665 RepID=UPI00278FD0E6|nr:TIR domain-containing protein [Arthrobacter globiformis]MDQ0618059.1 hypothetical protein [Arthrobacter globiformis]